MNPNDFSLSCSDAALEHIKTLIKESDNSPSFFHLTIYETGCTGLMYAPSLITKPNDTDIKILMNGLDIYVNKDAMIVLNGVYIDYVKVSLGQYQLTYDNPNADALCGCGESFNLKPGIEAPKIKKYSNKSKL